MTAVLTITTILFFIYLALIMYYRQSWVSIPGFDLHNNDQKPSTSITVIIPARNEELHIKTCLDAVCAQDYPKALFEVIVVDDHSTDDTAKIIDGYAAQNIKRIALSDHVESPLNSYKKKAIEVAVADSKGDLIVTTDADCVVLPGWLKTFAAFYESYRPALIAAPVLIAPPLPGESPSWGDSPGSGGGISLFQSLDFMTLQGITGASVHKKFHMMCNGANLAYEKIAFHEVNGFTGIDAIASGDDMLLMHKIFKQYPNRVLFLKSKNAIVKTAPLKTIGQFLSQRIRWASKADQYQDKNTFPVLLLVYLFNLSLLALPVISFFAQNTSMIICYWLLLLFGKTIVELFFLLPVASFFEKRKSLWWFPLMQPFHIVYTVVTGFLGKFSSYQWKGRSVK